MSRIHDALRKAERERAAHASIDVPSILTATSVQAPSTSLAPVSPHDAMASPIPTPEVPGLEGLRQRCAKPEWKPDPRTVVFANDGRSPLIAEQFRTLRSRLYRFREKHPCRTLLITSSLAGEGKTFVAANLASAIARQNERNTLLIDADLRASRLHQAFGAPASPGLSDYLGGELDEFSVIQSSPEGNLFFIPSGKAAENPAELLAGHRLKILLDRLTPMFDWIILDSPPVLPVGDAGLLAGLCDWVLLVVQAGLTPFDAAKKASREFRKKNLIGVVLNHAAEGDSYTAYSYYGADGKA
jgi:protein-tyrosine kinase